MTSQLIEQYYNITVSDIKLLDAHFGTEIYCIHSPSGNYVVKSMPLYMEHSENEGAVVEHLLHHGLSVARLLKSKNGNFTVKTPDFQFTVQKLIDGETYAVNTAPAWFMEQSAEFLGNSISALQQYPPLPLRFGADFFNPDTALWKKREYEAELAKSADAKMTELWHEHIRHLDKISKFHIDTGRLTYANSHGDYHIGQMIVKGEHLTVIDWTSACRLPIAFEVVTSFVFASPSCKDGAINTEELAMYIRTFTEYYPLTAYDMEAMPYVLYFWHTICNYRPDEAIAESYQPTAMLVNKLLAWLYDHVETLSEALKAI